MIRSAPPDLTAEEISLWRSFVMERSGLFFTDSRLYFLAQRLWERAQMHHLTNYADYYRYLVLSRDGQQEWQLLLDRLVNNETRFFRHKPSFRALRESILPQIWEQRGESKHPLALWSVGCSAGQEVYSLGMLLLEFILFPPSTITITGSDISCEKLRQAQNGRYHAFEADSLPRFYREKYMTKIERGRDTIYEIAPVVRRLISFHHLNLQLDEVYHLKKQDIIFCQNVLIYFKTEMRPKIVQRICDCLKPGGFLFLAPTDIVGLRLPQLRPIHFPDALVYQRVVT